MSISSRLGADFVQCFGHTVLFKRDAGRVSPTASAVSPDLLLMVADEPWQRRSVAA